MDLVVSSNTKLIILNPNIIHHSDIGGTLKYNLYDVEIRNKLQIKNPVLGIKVWDLHH